MVFLYFYIYRTVNIINHLSIARKRPLANKS